MGGSSSHGCRQVKGERDRNSECALQAIIVDEHTISVISLFFRLGKLMGSRSSPSLNSTYSTPSMSCMKGLRIEGKGRTYIGSSSACDSSLLSVGAP